MPSLPKLVLFLCFTFSNRAALSCFSRFFSAYERTMVFSFLSAAAFLMALRTAGEFGMGARLVRARPDWLC